MIPRDTAAWHRRTISCYNATTLKAQELFPRIISVRNVLACLPRNPCQILRYARIMLHSELPGRKEPGMRSTKPVGAKQTRTGALEVALTAESVAEFQHEFESDSTKRLMQNVVTRGMSMTWP